MMPIESFISGYLDSTRMEWLDISRVVVVIVILIIASYTDWRTRMASDLNWVFLGCSGMVMLVLEMVDLDVQWQYYLFLFPIAVLFLDLFWERRGLFENGLNLLVLALYSMVAVSLLFLYVTLGNEQLFWQYLTIPIMFVLLILMYQFDVIKGGADAKALIALSLVFPSYPIFLQFPIISIPDQVVTIAFPFSLLILFNAALLSLVVPIGLLFVNLSRKDVKVPAMFFGYKVAMHDVKLKFVWPMQRVEEGLVRFRYFPKKVEDFNQVLEQLADAGEKSIWVTPKIPFLLFITASVLLSAIVGNFVLLFLR
jgi:preflagellin peptidase FlaK